MEMMAKPSGLHLSTSRVTMDASGQITARITGVFDFDAARTILLEYKNLPEEAIAGITVHLDGVTHINSGGVGVLSLLQDLVGIERFALDLGNCAPLVRQLFESNILDPHVSARCLRRSATKAEVATHSQRPTESTVRG